MMTDMNMNEFLNVLSSKEPVPGGGGACGYVAAVGMSLGNMVLALTTGKKKYAEYQDEIEKLIVRANDLTKELAECMDIAASEAPLSMMEVIVEAIGLIDRISVIGSRLAISDAGVGVQMCKAALNGASLNVYINTKLMKDTDVADDMNTRTDELIIRGNQMADEVYDRVMDCVR